MTDRARRAQLRDRLYGTVRGCGHADTFTRQLHPARSLLITCRLVTRREDTLLVDLAGLADMKALLSTTIYYFVGQNLSLLFNMKIMARDVSLQCQLSKPVARPVAGTRFGNMLQQISVPQPVVSPQGHSIRGLMDLCNGSRAKGRFLPSHDDLTD